MMTLYSWLQPLLFKLEPERAHHLALQSAKFAYKLGLSRFYSKPRAQPQTLMGLTFPNRIGLSAGFDRNAEYIDALAALGFGFIEVGTIVPKPQHGNPKPRIFRLVKEAALLNRVGFASKGLDYALNQLKQAEYKGILGINIGKNKDTPNEKAINDYLLCFRSLWPFASYITINISSPNTQGLRDLLKKEALLPLLRALKEEQSAIHSREKKYVPLLVKISPDLSPSQLEDLATSLLQEKIDGVISANTTVHRDAILNSVYAKENGGLSGRPLSIRNADLIARLRYLLGPLVPIIASGGIMDETDAARALEAGANLLQLYTGLIYAGPGLIKRLGAVDKQKP